MKSESQIKHCLRECKLNSEEKRNLVDVDDNIRYMLGWIEALQWVLKSEPTITVTPDLQVKVE